MEKSKKSANKFEGIENNSYICTKKNKIYNRIMPEVFRFYGFSFFFYSREHEPPHIHVEGNDGMAKFDWDGKEFILVEKEGIKANDFRKIKKVVDENADIILKRWKEYFDND